MELTKEIRERFSQDVELSKETLYGALYEALKKIDGNCKTFLNTTPRACSVNNIYPQMLNGRETDDWTSGFGLECCGLLMRLLIMKNIKI